MASWRTLHPAWEYRLWTDSELAPLANRLSCPEILFGRRDLNVGILADLARYELLRLFGGVYTDVDFECIRPIDPLLVHGCLHFGEELEGRPAIGFLASPPSHPLWRLALAEIRSRLGARTPVDDKWDAISLTGPEAFARWIRGWIDAEPGRPLHDEGGSFIGTTYPDSHVAAFSRPVLYPYHYREHTWREFRPKTHPGAYAAHHWAGSWQ